MKRMDRIRAAFAAAATTVAPAALADGGSQITAAGWWSVAGVVGVVGVLILVHKKLN